MDIQETEYLQLSSYPIEFPPDVSIATDIIHGTAPGAAVGLAFRVENLENFYVFIVDGMANYWIIKILNGQVDVLHHSYAPVLSSVPLELKRVRVDVHGSKIQVFVNRHLLTTVYDDDLTSGTIGLIGWTADEPNKAVFSGLEVVSYGERAMPSSADCTLVTDATLSTELGDDIRILPLGPLGADAVVVITLQEEDVSMLLSAQTKDHSDIVMLGSITDPDGHLLYNLIDMETGEFESKLFTRPIQNEGEITIYLPASPDFELEAGDYELVLYTYEGKPICDAMAIIRSGPVDGIQTIDLNLWIASEAVNLNNPQEISFVETEIRAAIERILNQYEMRLGQIKFIPANAAQKEKYARSDDSNFTAICQSVVAAAGSGRAWNMALVDEYALLSPWEATNESETVLGMAPLPGSVFAEGSLTSCGIIAWEAHNGDYNELGATIVHEGSHFLGLPHTTEMDGQTFDSFADTTECSLILYDANGNGEVDDVECENADGGNYMFWVSSSYLDRFAISSDQAWTLRHHPLFYSKGMTE